MTKYLYFFYPPCNFLFKKIFKRELSKTTFLQIVKHYFVGFVISVFNYVIFVMLKKLGHETALSNTITYGVVVVASFLMQKYFTYNAGHHSIWQPILFLMNAITYYVLDTIILLILIDHFGVIPMISKLVSIGSLSPLSFIFQKFFVFKKKESDNVR
ncbi:MAG TPA: GtrA family protein [Spirochaetota bacterium]|nr:GtrA family protein [Spirochaetota bacterium]HNT11658.1 GtrA family protein [Spirochaetota bacterium]